MEKYLKGKVYIFIDAANILYSQQTLKWRIDYTKLIDFFQSQCDLGKIYYYTGKVGAKEKQLKFIEKLEKLGFYVISKEVKFIKISAKKFLPKANLDIELALDAFRYRSKYQTIILLSGDSDFSYLIKLLQKDNKRVIVMSTRGHISKELIEVSDKYFDLRKFKQELEYNKNQELAEATPEVWHLLL